MSKTISKADYEEPRCPLAKPTNVVPVPTGRIIEKLDSYFDKKDYLSAERHLKYWLEEAQAGNDKRGSLTILNEQIGLYRKVENKDEGIKAIEKALKLSEETAEDTVSMGTTLLNAATAYKAFSMAEEALLLYEKAKKIYEEHLEETDVRLAGLYNNMAVTLSALEMYDEARMLFDKALSIMEKAENGQLEMAMTYCSLADLETSERGIEEAEETVNKYLDIAEKLFDTPSLPRNGYYAFVCEKCAPAFGYYGYFLAEKELMRRAKEIYEGN